MKLPTAADRSSTREANPRAACGASPVSRRKAMSFVLRCLSDSGTIEAPSPAATRFKGRGQLQGLLAEPGTEARTLAGGDHGSVPAARLDDRTRRPRRRGPRVSLRDANRRRRFEFLPPTRTPDGSNPHRISLAT